MKAFSFALAAFAATASAASLSDRSFSHHRHAFPSKGGKAVCVSGFVSVPASTDQNIKFDFKIPQNQTETTQIPLDIITAGSTFSSDIMGPKNTVSGVYNIGVTLCKPSSKAEPKGVQFLTHGVGFDRCYWDFAPGYSYVDVAAEHGYASFLYDRLGVGQSASPKLDPIQEVQSPLEVEIANNLAKMLKNGTFGGVEFESVIGVGHSFGSIITEAITAQYPSTFDASVLTGFSTYSTGMPPFFTGLNLALANRNQPLRFPELNNGYLVSDTTISNQIGFFRFPGFDPLILSASEASKGSVTFGELFTTTAVTAPAANYSSPVVIVNGDADLPFCFGNCSYPMNHAKQVKSLYPQVPDSKFDTYLAPVAGHGLNLHYSAEKAYEFIQHFLEKQGLGMGMA